MVKLETKTIGVDETAESLKAMKQGINKAEFRAMSKSVKVVERQVRTNIISRFETIQGKLKNSPTSSVAVLGDKVIGLVGLSHPGARLLEEGGDIKPTKKQFLAVPMSKFAKTRRPRDFLNQSFVLKAGDNLFIVRPSGTRLEFLYRLSKEEHIDGRNYMSDAVRTTNAKVVGFLGKEIAIVVAK